MLIHKTVQSSFPELITFSIGISSSRRTVVAFKTTCERAGRDTNQMSEPTAGRSRGRGVGRGKDLSSNERVNRWVRDREARRLNKLRWGGRDESDVTSVTMAGDGNVLMKDDENPETEGRQRFKQMPQAQIYVPPSLRAKQPASVSSSIETNPSPSQTSASLPSEENAIIPKIDKGPLSGSRGRGRGRGKRKPEVEVYVPRALRALQVKADSSEKKVSQETLITSESGNNVGENKYESGISEDLPSVQSDSIAKPSELDMQDVDAHHVNGQLNDPKILQNFDETVVSDNAFTTNDNEDSSICVNDTSTHCVEDNLVISPIALNIVNMPSSSDLTQDNPVDCVEASATHNADNGQSHVNELKNVETSSGNISMTPSTVATTSVVSDEMITSSDHTIHSEEILSQKSSVSSVNLAETQSITLKPLNTDEISTATSADDNHLSTVLAIPEQMSTSSQESCLTAVDPKIDNALPHTDMEISHQSDVSTSDGTNSSDHINTLAFITPCEKVDQSQNDIAKMCEKADPLPSEEDAEDCWDAMFDDNGDCLDESLLEELTQNVGKVAVDQPKINYLKFEPKQHELDCESFGHIVEIYDFSPELATCDIISAFRDFASRGFDVKWVDDTHALGVFSSAVAATEALHMVHPLLKVRPMSLASRQGQKKARHCQEFLQPYKARPQTTTFAASRLVAGALGMARKVPKEVRDQERQKLKEAKAKRQQEKQQKVDIWDGSVGKCAMDER